MTTNYRIVSDLHLEFDRTWMLPIMPDENLQTLILAGDIVPLQQVNNFRAFFDDVAKRFKCVLWVPGNHEYYGGDLTDVPSEFLDDYHNIIYAQSGYADDLLTAATLWTDFDDNPVHELAAAQQMSDYYEITNKGLKLFPYAIRNLHYRHKKFIFDNLSDVVVTHHAPSWQSVNERFKGDSLNSCFVNNFDAIIVNSPVKLWIHGHTHDNVDYMIGGTRVVCNPKGYGRENKNFDPYWVISI